ncbi:MAG TPA: aminodeoxychorismate/anthranilate synthase component II [Cyanobacteria bacterium UBA8530]|nr:aminodeoxychorismate/anthranilate synthase component II [Cyanobacteria bacterium UBA8530]
MKILLIDNYDSFTFNLYQYLGELGNEPTVCRNDMISLEEVEKGSFTHIVLSPGPGSPDKTRDFGVCGPIIRELGSRIPILGVCLGHQGIIHHLGGHVVRAPRIVHGKTSRIRHDGKGLFSGLPPEITVMRYHSLLGDRESLPACLRVTAETIEDRLVMAVQHETWPLYGIQFHPESIGTPDGKAMLANFLEA